MRTIRTYAAADREHLWATYRRAGEGSPTGTLWGHEQSEAAIYLLPYVEAAADTLFLAFEGDTLVGYLTGSPDSSTLPSEGDRFTRAMADHRVYLRPSAVRFFARATRDAVAAKMRRRSLAGDFEDSRWPAHLHINVVPEARGTGAADDLMTAWLDHLRTIGDPGCHLQTLSENVRAVRFFARFGFTAYGPALAVPGLRHRGGRLHQQTMVRPAP